MPSSWLPDARLVASVAVALAGALACAQERAPAPAYPTYGPPAPGAPAPGAPAGPGTAPGTAQPPVNGSDPVNATDIAFLRKRAEQILAELVAALPQPQQARVSGIPLVVDATPGEVNAFASCSGSRSAMAVSDGLLQIESQLARFRAADELGGTNKVGEYIAIIARGAGPGRPLPVAPAGFVDPRIDLDPRKLARQYQLLDEQIAFVMGHELGHHYLGHLPCTAGGGLTLAEIGALLSSAVPGFNQPNELAADVVGTSNLLTMGARRTDYRLTEGGAMLTMQFFAGLDQLTPADILFGFERSHPPPQLRTPVIQQTAAAWRATGGRGLPILF
ncbi:MAG TPA: M48 family metalloprotease [Polyangiaceae bacterium]|nr:M48 family metalloprotease [Polyangiaceae bacterium]